MRSLAKQLRQAQVGEWQKELAKKMNESNSPLYDFALDAMQLAKVTTS